MNTVFYDERSIFQSEKNYIGERFTITLLHEKGPGHLYRSTNIIMIVKSMGLWYASRLLGGTRNTSSVLMGHFRKSLFGIPTR